MTQHTLGVSPLKSAMGPSSRSKSRTIVTPRVFCSKFAFWMRVLIVSRGAATVIDATAPATEATRFCVHVALL
jgi:hypothetical protein